MTKNPSPRDMRASSSIVMPISKIVFIEIGSYVSRALVAALTNESIRAAMVRVMPSPYVKKHVDESTPFLFQVRPIVSIPMAKEKCIRAKIIAWPLNGPQMAAHKPNESPPYNPRAIALRAS